MFRTILRTRSLQFRWLLATMLALSIGQTATAQTLTTDVAQIPANAEFVYSDIEHFLEAQVEIGAGGDPAEVLQRLYLDRASPGLREFITKYDLTTERLIAALARFPDDYARLPETLRHLRANESRFREVYVDLQAVVANAVFPPTYFVVGGHRGIGSGSIAGPLISVEKETPEGISGDLAATVVHEMIHLQQLAAVGDAYYDIFSGPGRTLLAVSIREGASTFFSELIAGGSYHKNLARDYYRPRERQLWAEFSGEMHSGEMGDWLYREPDESDRPNDIGYAIGAEIVRTFYDAATDKAAAVKTILSITDYPEFLDLSGYPDQISDRSRSP